MQTCVSLLDDDPNEAKIEAPKAVDDLLRIRGLKPALLGMTPHARVKCLERIFALSAGDDPKVKLLVFRSFFELLLAERGADADARVALRKTCALLGLEADYKFSESLVIDFSAQLHEGREKLQSVEEARLETIVGLITKDYKTIWELAAASGSISDLRMEIASLVNKSLEHTKGRRGVSKILECGGGGPRSEEDSSVAESSSEGECEDSTRQKRHKPRAGQECSDAEESSNLRMQQPDRIRAQSSEEQVDEEASVSLEAAGDKPQCHSNDDSESLTCAAGAGCPVSKNDADGDFAEDLRIPNAKRQPDDSTEYVGQKKLKAEVTKIYTAVVARFGKQRFHDLDNDDPVYAFRIYPFDKFIYVVLKETDERCLEYTHFTTSTESQKKKEERPKTAKANFSPKTIGNWMTHALTDAGFPDVELRSGRNIHITRPISRIKAFLTPSFRKVGNMYEVAVLPGHIPECFKDTYQKSKESDWCKRLMPQVEEFLTGRSPRPEFIKEWRPHAATKSATITVQERSGSPEPLTSVGPGLDSHLAQVPAPTVAQAPMSPKPAHPGNPCSSVVYPSPVIPDGASLQLSVSEASNAGTTSISTSVLVLLQICSVSPNGRQVFSFRKGNDAWSYVVPTDASLLVWQEVDSEVSDILADTLDAILHNSRGKVLVGITPEINSRLEESLHRPEAPWMAFVAPVHAIPTFNNPQSTRAETAKAGSLSGVKRKRDDKTTSPTAGHRYLRRELELDSEGEAVWNSSESDES